VVQTVKVMRRPFYADAVQVTETNMAEVAKWCQGTIVAPDNGAPYIRVNAFKAQTERQNRAFAGDWVLYAGSNVKVYTNSAFNNSFMPYVTGEQDSADS